LTKDEENRDIWRFLGSGLTRITDNARMKNTGPFLKGLFLSSAMALCGMRASAQNAMPTGHKTPIPDSVQRAKVGYFELLCFEHDATQRWRMHELHNRIHTVMDRKAAMVYSSDNAGDYTDTWGMLDTLSSATKTKPDILPIIFISAHGSVIHTPIHDGEFVDTLLGHHSYQIGRTVELDKGKPTQRDTTVADGLLSANIFSNIGRNLNNMPAAQIFPACEGGGAVANAGYAPAGSHTLFLSPATDVSWDRRDYMVMRAGSERKAHFSSIPQVIGAFIKQMNASADDDSAHTNLAIIGVTTSDLVDSKEDLHHVRVIGMAQQLSHLYQRYGAAELQKAADDIAAEELFDPVTLKRGLNGLMDTAALNKSVKSAFFGDDFYDKDLRAAQVIAYRVCLNHLDEMPLEKDYEATVNRIPDARRAIDAGPKLQKALTP
jgi:hypothetical protein